MAGATGGRDCHPGGYPLPYTTLTEFGKIGIVNEVGIHGGILRTLFVNIVVNHVDIWGFGVHVLSTSNNMRQLM